MAASAPYGAREDLTPIGEAAMNTVTDRRPHLRSAYAQAAALVAGVRPDELGRPTPCTEFDVAALVDHLVFAAHRAARLGRGEVAISAGAAHLEPGAAAAAIRASATEAERAWTDDRLTATITMPWGQVYSGADLVDMYTMELVAHAWDLAAAVGRLDELDESLAEVALDAGRPLVPAEYRGGEMPFAAVVEVPAGAGAYDRLAGFLGRVPA